MAQSTVSLSSLVFIQNADFTEYVSENHHNYFQIAATVTETKIKVLCAVSDMDETLTSSSWRMRCPAGVCILSFVYPGFDILTEPRSRG